MLTQKADALEDLLAGGGTLGEAAKELKLKVKKVGPFSRTGTTPDNGKVTTPNLNNFVPLAFSIPEGETSSISLGKPGLYYLVQADQVIDEQLPPIAKVKEKLVKSWKASKRDTHNIQHAKEVSAKLADTKARDVLIDSKGVKKVASGKVNRNSLKLGGVTLPVEMVQAIFAANIGDTTLVSKLGNGRFIVASVEGSFMPALKDKLDSKEATQIRTDIQSNQQQELMKQLMNHLNEKYNVSVNQSVLTQIGQSDSFSRYEPGNHPPNRPRGSCRL